jgi:hypothetical protein
LTKRKTADKEKELLCKAKNIKLLVIPYFKSSSEHELIDFIKKGLLEFNIEFDPNAEVDFTNFYKSNSKVREMHEAAGVSTYGSVVRVIHAKQAMLKLKIIIGGAHTVQEP